MRKLCRFRKCACADFIGAWTHFSFGYCFSFIHFSIINKRIVAQSNLNYGLTPPHVFFLFEWCLIFLSQFISKVVGKNISCLYRADFGAIKFRRPNPICGVDKEVKKRAVVKRGGKKERKSFPPPLLFSGKGLKCRWNLFGDIRWKETERTHLFPPPNLCGERFFSLLDFCDGGVSSLAIFWGFGLWWLSGSECGFFFAPWADRSR